MSIKATIVADSLNIFGNRLTTMVVTFPRILLSEFNTHRMFSRNTASSRAIPFHKLLEMVKLNPFVPIAWQRDHKGMQGTEYFSAEEAKILAQKWLRARDRAVESALDLAAGLFAADEVFEFSEEDQLLILQDVVGVTKQLCNRLLEPFMWTTAIVTSSEWSNFFELRCPQYSIRANGGGELFRSRKEIIANYGSEEEHLMTKLDWLKKNQGQAEIHMMALAEAMWDVFNESTPKQLKHGEWHIPFGDNIDLPSPIPIDFGFSLEEGVWIRKAKIATARCARTSYTVVGEEDKLANYDNDIKLHDRLESVKHASPFEHCAAQATTADYRSRNFTGGWLQYREIIGL